MLKSPILPSNCYCDILDKDNTKELLLELGRTIENVKLANAPVENSIQQAQAPVVKCQVCRYNEQLSLKHLPDMVFPDNYLHLLHERSGVVLEFNTLEAIKLIAAHDSNPIQVDCSEAWQASKSEMGLPQNMHDYNWTFSTDYQGSIKSLRDEKEVAIIQNPSEELNIEKLKQRENILFYEELTLFEDELHDNGISNLSVKLRAMPSGFFILLRHALRVDHVMARICDTRIHYEVGNDYFLRQLQIKQESFKNLADIDPQKFSDMNVLANLLPVTKEVTEKVVLNA